MGPLIKRTQNSMHRTDQSKKSTNTEAGEVESGTCNQEGRILAKRAAYDEGRERKSNPLVLVFQGLFLKGFSDNSELGGSQTNKHRKGSRL